MSHTISQAPSHRWHPVKVVHRGAGMPGVGNWDEWENDRYFGTVRRIEDGMLAGGIVIGITPIDQSAAHDWRDFQNIKNDLAGREWEAVELYPAESRLRDPSNRFYLWCAPKGTFNFGFTSRHVRPPASDIVGQRPWPAGDRPWLITQFNDVPGIAAPAPLAEGGTANG